MIREPLVAWLATKAGRAAACRLVRIDWQTVGRIIGRVAGEQFDKRRLDGLFDIGIDEIAGRGGHRYLTLVGDRPPRRQDRLRRRGPQREGRQQLLR